MANKINTVLYIGITDDLQRRAFEHKESKIKGFTQQYKVNKLVFFEEFSNPTDAISAEKRLKGWNRWKKVQLIQKSNPNWNDLSIE